MNHYTSLFDEESSFFRYLARSEFTSRAAASETDRRSAGLPMCAHSSLWREEFWFQCLAFLSLCWRYQYPWPDLAWRLSPVDVESLAVVLGMIWNLTISLVHSSCCSAVFLFFGTACRRRKLSLSISVFLSGDTWREISSRGIPRRETLNVMSTCGRRCGRRQAKLPV